MATLINDPDLERQLRRKRAAWGADHYDEVWNGVYFMSPLADAMHQALVGRLYASILAAVEMAGLGVAFPGVNVSDQAVTWRKNFRVPDVAVFLNGTAAQNKGSHWFGGPDFAVEVTSRGDRTHKKLPFYAKVGTRELLVVNRATWTLELYRLEEHRLTLSGTVQPGDGFSLASTVIPLSFALQPGTPRPVIEIAHSDGVQRWQV